MKELAKSLLALLGALVMSVFAFSWGIIWSIGYSFLFSFSKKYRDRYKPKWGRLYFIYFWIKFADGILAAIGHLIYAIGYALDLCWNVNGEGIEDLMTAKEDTTFGQKNISVSASIGKLEIDGNLTKFGKGFSKALNFAFQQKSHAKGAWRYLQARIENQEMFNQK